MAAVASGSNSQSFTLSKGVTIAWNEEVLNPLSSKESKKIDRSLDELEPKVQAAAKGVVHHAVDSAAQSTATFIKTMGAVIAPCSAHVLTPAVDACMKEAAVRCKETLDPHVEAATHRCVEATKDVFSCLKS